jgi:hypothetical protein
MNPPFEINLKSIYHLTCIGPLQFYRMSYILKN